MRRHQDIRGILTASRATAPSCHDAARIRGSSCVTRRDGGKGGGIVTLNKRSEGNVHRIRDSLRARSLSSLARHVLALGPYRESHYVATMSRGDRRWRREERTRRTLPRMRFSDADNPRRRQSLGGEEKRRAGLPCAVPRLRAEDWWTRHWVARRCATFERRRIAICRRGRSERRVSLFPLIASLAEMGTFRARPRGALDLDFMQKNAQNASIRER